MSATTTLAVVASLFALGFAPRVAQAAPCGRPDVDDTFPPNGAAGVPPNATLAAHYAAPADYVDEVVTLTGPQGDVPVDVSYDEAESMLRARPLAELSQGHFAIAWPGLRGVATSRGLGLTVEFTAGGTRDEAAPRFSGLAGVEWDLTREEDPCTDSLEDRFWFDLRVGSASDDLAPELLTLVVFETRGGNKTSGSPPEQIAVVPFPAKRSVRVQRPAVGDETVCFAAVTRDLVNQVSGGGDEQVCVETTAPPFFDGCSLGGRPKPGGAGALALAVSFVLAARRRGARRA
jgi:hypothetical protein